MNIPDAAIDAAAEAAKLSHYDAQLAIEAAMPAIREALAREIEGDLYSTNGHGVPYIDGRNDAARIVRNATC